MDQSRRDALKKLGIGTGAAWAAPAVTVLVVPQHAHATSSSSSSASAVGTYSFPAGGQVTISIPTANISENLNGLSGTLTDTSNVTMSLQNAFSVVGSDYVSASNPITGGVGIPNTGSVTVTVGSNSYTVSKT